ncbi:site-specific DNA-methyltransferase [Baileyella intestinalis]|uniref:site-specific DNA-methyltransferase n=1 Tax=Baileyella intestinalis TaxID=2606709 RepID=UPI003A8C1A21
MEKLKMHTPDLAEENYKKLAELFPNAVTEAKDEEGNTVRAIDADVLRQEISATVVEGDQERYQFTWPDKRKSIVLANAPIAKTLRLEKEKSVGRDGTPGGTDSENIYIEGDNLDALKLLRETYLGKVKMIYIDPPYNTGNDFIYEDDFSQRAADYVDNSGQTDEEGNRLVQNTEGNGRFHTDWLNMLYPRLKIAKDLLTIDGLIFISIDDNELTNLRKICNEIFGEQCFVGQISLLCNPKGRSQDKYVANCHEYILIYSHSVLKKGSVSIPKSKEEISKDYSMFDEKGNPYRVLELRNTHRDFGKFNRPKLWYPFYVEHDGNISLENNKESEEVFPVWDDGFEGCWTWGKEKSKNELHLLTARKIEGKYKIYRKAYAFTDDDAPLKQVKSIWTDKAFFTEKGQICLNGLFDTKEKYFQSPKSPAMIKQCISMSHCEDGIILDFFSGSATTVQSAFMLNAEDGGDRKIIAVQINEKIDQGAEAFKAGYETICDIGEERIRRAGKKIKEETGAEIDYGFRCFKVDSTNMEDVFQRPADLSQDQLSLFDSNIKHDRTPEDLLIQVMLDLGVLLSSKIEEIDIKGKRVFSVSDGYLLACFDENVDEDVVTEIAQKKPYYAVFRDSSMADDSVAANFEQIFATYSPQTVRKVL